MKHLVDHSKLSPQLYVFYCSQGHTRPLTSQPRPMRKDSKRLVSLALPAPVASKAAARGEDRADALSCTCDGSRVVGGGVAHGERVVGAWADGLFS